MQLIWQQWITLSPVLSEQIIAMSKQRYCHFTMTHMPETLSSETFAHT